MSRLGRQVTRAGARAPAGPGATYDVEGTATEYDIPPGRLER